MSKQIGLARRRFLGSAAAATIAAPYILKFRGALAQGRAAPAR